MLRGKLLIQLVFISVVWLGLQSCAKEVLDMKQLENSNMLYNPSLAVNLLHGTLTMDDLLESIDSSQYVSVDDNGLLVINYHQDIYSFSANDVFTIPRQDYIEFFFQSDQDFPPFPGSIGQQIHFTRDSSYTFVTNRDEQFDSIFVKSGGLQVFFSSTFQHDVTFIVTLPSVTRNGVVLSETFTASNSSSDAQAIDLSGCVVRLTNESGIMKLPLHYDITIVNSGNGIDASQSINFQASLLDMHFSALYGYMGTYDLVNESDTVDFDFFSKNLNGDLVFADPRISLNIDNSYGVPAALNLGFVSVSSRNSTTDTFTYSDNPVVISAPALPGQSTSTSIDINNTNSNIVDIMASYPERFYLNVTGQANPIGITFTNFVLDTSKIDVDFDLKLPLDLKASGFSFGDTMDLDLSETFNDVDLDTIIFHLETSNSIPIDLTMQVYFTDSNYLVVDSLFSNTVVLASGVADASGIVTQASESVNNVYIGSDRLENLKRTRFAIFQPSIATYNEGTQFVKIYNTNGVSFKLFVQTQINVKPND
jgi:hypothetical protein